MKGRVLMIIAILIFVLLAIISNDLIVAGLQLAFIIVVLPFIFIYQFIYQLLKLVFNKGKKANES